MLRERRVDRSSAIAPLIAPLVLGRLSTLPDFDCRETARAAVDGFLYVKGRRDAGLVPDAGNSDI